MSPLTADDSRGQKRRHEEEIFGDISPNHHKLMQHLFDTSWSKLSVMRMNPFTQNRLERSLWRDILIERLIKRINEELYAVAKGNFKAKLAKSTMANLDMITEDLAALNPPSQVDFGYPAPPTPAPQPMEMVTLDGSTSDDQQDITNLQPYSTELGPCLGHPCPQPVSQTPSPLSVPQSTATIDELSISDVSMLSVAPICDVSYFRLTTLQPVSSTNECMSSSIILQHAPSVGDFPTSELTQLQPVTSLGEFSNPELAARQQPAASFSELPNRHCEPCSSDRSLSEVSSPYSESSSMDFTLEEFVTNSPSSSSSNVPSGESSDYEGECVFLENQGELTDISPDTLHAILLPPLENFPDLEMIPNTCLPGPGFEDMDFWRHIEGR